MQAQSDILWHVPPRICGNVFGLMNSLHVPERCVEPSACGSRSLLSLSGHGIAELACQMQPARLSDMNARVHELLAEAQSLPAEDRSLLAWALLDSLEGGGADEALIEKAWIAESQRRSDELKSGATVALPWEDVKAKLLAL